MLFPERYDDARPGPITIGHCAYSITLNLLRVCVLTVCTLVFVGECRRCHLFLSRRVIR